MQTTLSTQITIHNNKKAAKIEIKFNSEERGGQGAQGGAVTCAAHCGTHMHHTDTHRILTESDVNFRERQCVC